MRGADGRLIEAIIGALLATALLVAAFSVVAQEPAGTNRVTIRPTAPTGAPAASDSTTLAPAIDVKIHGSRTRAGNRDLSGPLFSGDDLACEYAPRRVTAADEDDGRNVDPADFGSDLFEPEHSLLDACSQREGADWLGLAIVWSIAPSIPAVPPCPAPVSVAWTPIAAEIAPSGGGGCVVARNGAPDLVLPLLAL
jgi:hypothetical protein